MKNNTTPKRITLVDVAKKAQVSRATASLVLRGSDLVADKTRERVLAAMEELGYVYNRAAASLRTQRSMTVGLIVTDLTNPFFAQMTAGIQSNLEAEGYALLLAVSSDTLRRQDNLVEAMFARGVDGILLCPARGSDQTLLERLHQWQLPAVFVARYIQPESDDSRYAHDYVGADNEHGAYMAVQHLINLGHRRIAFVGGPIDSSARHERLKGYEQALRANQIPVDSNLVVASPVTRDGGYQAIEALADADDFPSAMLCYNDVVAIGAILRMKDIGIEPGVDVALIGFDDIADAALWKPRLSTVSITPQLLGEKAAELILRRMREPDRAAEHAILPSKLIIRDSSEVSAPKEP